MFEGAEFGSAPSNHLKPMKIVLDQPFPAFSLPAIDASGNEALVTNESQKGKAWVVFVYPKDQTSGCTLEACGFRELYSQFQEKGVEVFGLSRDSLKSHTKFITAQTLPYPLMADNGGAWLQENGLITPGTMYGKPVTRVARTTAFIDENGIVKQLWESVSPPGHAQGVLDWVQANR